MLKFEFLICLVLKDLSKCQTISNYLQKDIDIVSALQVVDSMVKTLQSMQNETAFKIFCEASRLAEEMDIEIALPRLRKVTRRLMSMKISTF